jgi:hypothetical protein
MFSQRRQATSVERPDAAQARCQELLQDRSILEDAVRLLALQDLVKESYIEIGRIKKRIKAAKNSRVKSADAVFDGPADFQD